MLRSARERSSAEEDAHQQEEKESEGGGEGLARADAPPKVARSSERYYRIFFSR